MLVEEIMNQEVVTLRPTAPISEALALLEEHRIRHIPIVDDKNCVIGIVSDRDIRDASPSSLIQTTNNRVLNEEIQTIMSHPVITVHPMDFVEDIAHIFYDKEIASLPVVQDDNLIGIVTEKDMLYTFIHLTGTHVQSSLVEVKVPDVPGIIPKVTEIFGRRKVNIASILVYPYKNDPDYKVLVFRIQTMNPNPIIQDLREAGYSLMWPNDSKESRL
ncbi:acetoin utilization AcuB family protein [Oceanobacillus senegalensis]|uniref:acetoin utilization AcuB family protein n=1 Tax=Oceanobacillus senegalensis TaxID=1936063 RepID=UPI000A30C2E3|nr:acetoin utilization AcuB family protein [Oceanobacillus senegalensis]